MRGHQGASQIDTGLRSYGRRRGRKPSARQQVLKREVLPRVAFDPMQFETTVVSQQASQQVAVEPREIWLEIGFGGGEHLLWQAHQNPNVVCLGCEPFENGVVKVLDTIERDKLANIRLYMGDARDVLRALPEAVLARVFILFPDPWPKKKHVKRRLVNPSTLSLVARAMKPGAELRIATDIGDYARTMHMALRGEPQLTWTAQGPADWRTRPADGCETRYESKAAREGRRCYYFRFQRR